MRDLDVLVDHLRARRASARRRRTSDAFLVLLRALEAEHAADRAAAPGRARTSRASSRSSSGSRPRRRRRRSSPAGGSLRALAGREFRRLRKTVRALGEDPPDAELHAARIAVKRARYSAELAERSVGKAATARHPRRQAAPGRARRPPGRGRRRGPRARARDGRGRAPPRRSRPVA